MISKLVSLWKNTASKITYYYPLDEDVFEHDPTKVRTSEMSQFQDEARDIESRSPEREEYEHKFDHDLDDMSNQMP